MNTENKHPKDLHEALDWAIKGKLERLSVAGEQWYLNAEVFPSLDLERLRCKPFVMPAPPEGQQWHRDDFTEEDLPDGYRPMLLGEKREHMQDEAACTSFKDTFSPQAGSGFIEKGDELKWRTRRPLPAPKPEPRYIPFTRETIPMPLVVRGKWSGDCAMVLKITDDSVVISNSDPKLITLTFTGLLGAFTLQDGTPAGQLVS